MWNFRVIKHREPTTGEEWLGIHEVYYAEDNDDHPLGFSVDPVPVTSTEGIEGLGWQLGMMRAAIDKPVLNETDFPSRPMPHTT